MNTRNPYTLNILLADDGSEHSQAAVKLIGNLPLDKQSRIMALRVFTPSETDKVWGLEKSLKATEKALLNQGMQIESDLVMGHPAEKIIEVAEKQNDDLIVIGAKGLRATLGIFLGGVVQQVAEHAELPVLVVRAPYKGLNRVLLLIDGSEESKKMLAYMGSFPLPPETRIEVLHVAPPIPREEDFVQYWPSGIDVAYTVPIEKLQEQVEERAREEELFGKKISEESINLLQEQGLTATSIFLRGDAATEIIQYTKDHQIDLIVSGGRGLSPIKSWLLGSVSRKLLHYAPCSVMVVKGKKEK